MATKKKVNKAPDWHTGLQGNSDLNDIPDFCLVKNRKPLTPELQAKLDEQLKASGTVTADAERTDFNKPKGMSWEDWDAHKAQADGKRNAANAERFNKLQAEHPREETARTKLRKAEGMVDAHQLAPLCGVLAKHVRKALRDTPAMKTLKPAAGWVFPQADVPQVVEAVKAYWASKGSKGSKAKAKAPEAKPAKASKKAKPGSERAALKHTPPSASKSKVVAKAVDTMLAKLPAKKKK